MAESYANGGERPLVQWSFLQFKKIASSKSTPSPCFLHSSTQIGSKLLIYGGIDYYGELLSQLFIYDYLSLSWSSPGDESQYQDDHPGKRYGHSAVLIEMHPPKLMIFGGMIDDKTFNFDASNTLLDSPTSSSPSKDRSSNSGSSDQIFDRAFMKSRRKKGKAIEECDDSVYFLSLTSERWVWTKPLVAGTALDKPTPRAEHTACKTGSNEVSIFGGWIDNVGPTNELWVFNFVDMEWKKITTSGVQPRPRYRHTAEVISNKMYILGGSEDNDDICDGNKHLGIHELSLDTMQWVHPQLKGINPFPRSGHATALIGAKSVGVFGGKRSNTIFLNDLILIDLETYSTTVINAVESHLPSPVSSCTMVGVGNKCFVFGGVDAKGACYNDIRVLEVSYYLDKHDITVGEGASSDYSFKILIIGDSSVGKSALLTRFSDNVYLPSYTSTIGIDFNSRMIRVDRSICKLEIWDTAGQERFSTITANYYRGAQGALLVYDVGLKESFEHVKNWYDRAIQLGGQDLVCVLVGNKNDLPIEEVQVSTTEGQLLADELGIPFLETSALNGTNVEGAFVKMTSNIKASVDRRGLTGVKAGALKKAGTVELADKERKMGVLSKCGCT